MLYAMRCQAVGAVVVSSYVSSAGSEQPKFCCITAGRSVIVKFSPAGNAPAEEIRVHCNAFEQSVADLLLIQRTLTKSTIRRGASETEQRQRYLEDLRHAGLQFVTCVLDGIADTMQLAISQFEQAESGELQQSNVWVEIIPPEAQAYTAVIFQVIELLAPAPEENHPGAFEEDLLNHPWIKRRNKTANTCKECGCRVPREAGYIVAAPTRNGRTTELTYCDQCATSAADESDELNIFMIIMWVILFIFAVLAVAAKG